MNQVNNENELKQTTVSYFVIFRFATKREKILMVFACFFAMAGGAGLPLFSLVFGSLTNSLAPPAVGGKNPKIIDQASNFASYFIYICFAVF